jgi:hypothetical protein
VTLNTGGWNTPTTHRRMNEVLHFSNLGLSRRVGKSDFDKSDTYTFRIPC